MSRSISPPRPAKGFDLATGWQSPKRHPHPSPQQAPCPQPQYKDIKVAIPRAEAVAREIIERIDKEADRIRCEQDAEWGAAHPPAGPQSPPPNSTPPKLTPPTPDTTFATIIHRPRSTLGHRKDRPLYRHDPILPRPPDLVDPVPFPDTTDPTMPLADESAPELFCQHSSAAHLKDGAGGSLYLSTPPAHWLPGNPPPLTAPFLIDASNSTMSFRRAVRGSSARLKGHAPSYKRLASARTEQHVVRNMPNPSANNEHVDDDADVSILIPFTLDTSHFMM